MSAAILMNESWKPTVIQLVPFANNNTRRTQQVPYRNSQKRGFPVLAVTRTSSCEPSSLTESQDANRRSESRAVFNSETNSDVPFYGRQPTNYVKKDMKSNSKARDRDNECDTARYSVQDLNEQATRPSSISSIESKLSASSIGVTEMPVSGPKFLPKPSVTSGRYFINYQQGKGMVKLTPGEEDIQRHKENFAREQSLKRKRYKLNVNQLPRSTTPITDHDPDKLNMKQVIQFLQNQKSVVKAPKSHVQISRSSEKTLTYTKSPRGMRHFNGEYIKSEKQLGEKASLHDSNKVNRNSMASRGSTVTPSVVSTKSSPSANKHETKSASSCNSTSTAKSMIERRNKRTDKQAKEFKLFRFLSVTSEGERKSGALITASQKTSPRNDDSSEDRTNHCKDKMVTWVNEDPEPEVKYRSTVLRVPCHESNESVQVSVSDSSSESKKMSITIKIEEADDTSGHANSRKKLSRTANVVHRKVRKHQRKSDKDFTPEQSTPDTKMEETKSEKINSGVNSTIRLPSMKDYPDEKDEEPPSDICDDDSDIISAISKANTLARRPYSDNVITTNMLKNSHKVYAESPRYEYLDNPLPVKHLTNGFMDFSSPTKNSVMENNVLGTLMTKKPHSERSQSDYKPNTRQKKIMVTIPNEMDQEEDVVKLSLRHEKDVTREQSYMTDMARGHSKRTPMTVMYHNSRNLPLANLTDDFMDNDIIRISTVSMQQRKGLAGFDDDQTNATNTMANSCIKVRQKLKANLQ